MYLILYQGYFDSVVNWNMGGSTRDRDALIIQGNPRVIFKLELGRGTNNKQKLVAITTLISLH
jgi:hypothetical protein